MTVGTHKPIIQYAYTGPADFSFPWALIEDTDITVIFDPEGDEVQAYDLSLGNDYTVSLNPTAFGGYITVTEPAALTGVLTICRILAVDQIIDWLNDGPFDANVLETSIDKLTMICQQLEYGLLSVNNRISEPAQVQVPAQWGQMVWYDNAAVHPGGQPMPVLDIYGNSFPDLDAGVHTLHVYLNGSKLLEEVDSQIISGDYVVDTALNELSFFEDIPIGALVVAEVTFVADIAGSVPVAHTHTMADIINSTWTLVADFDDVIAGKATSL